MVFMMRSEIMEVSMDYKYDIFISYKEDGIHNWFNWNFMDMFKWVIEGKLQRNVVFYDYKKDMSIRNWKIGIKQALAQSRCLLAFFRPMYFKSEYCLLELMTMLEREKREGFDQKRNSHRLVCAVNVQGDDKDQPFPDLVSGLQYFDCRDYFTFAEDFKKTEKYYEFESKLRVWAPEVAKTVAIAPVWKKEWFDFDISVPEILDPVVLRPSLE